MLAEGIARALACSDSRRPPEVVPHEPAQTHFASQLSRGGRWSGLRWRPPRRGTVRYRRVRPLSVVVVRVLLGEAVQMPGPQHDEPVQALGPERPDEPLGVGVQVGAAVRQHIDPDPGSAQRGVELAPELRVAVAEDHPRVMPGGAGRADERLRFAPHPGRAGRQRRGR